MKYQDFARGTAVTIVGNTILGESAPFITPWYLRIAQAGPKTMNECIDDVIADSSIGILVFHGFGPGKTEWTTTNSFEFIKVCEYIAQKRDAGAIDCVTLGELLEYRN